MLSEEMHVFCTKCGLQNPSGAKYCVGCGTVLRDTPTGPGSPAGSGPGTPSPASASTSLPVIQDYFTHNLVIAISGFFCCFVPGILGVVGLINALNVRTHLARHDLAAAQASARTAKTFFTIGLVFLIILVVFWLAYFGIVMGVVLFDEATP
jgi:hypothetical protein